MLVSVIPASAFGASIKDDFTIAWKQFHALSKNHKKAKYRSEWEKVGKKFRNVFKRSTRGQYAPKSLYYLGRTYEELGNRSGIKKISALLLRKLHEKDLAYSDYLTIVHRYAKSDMYSKARK
ncbi:N-acetylmuramoyl-L-alanine amidase, partial [Aduncisulcus paluster]